jgi:hypothetical protein
MRIRISRSAYAIYYGLKDEVVMAVVVLDCRQKPVSIMEGVVEG